MLTFNKKCCIISVILGIILPVVFGAANTYLGLRVGMTVSVSIPAAVISMGVIRFILRKNSILENNIVQTIGPAGEFLSRNRAVVQDDPAFTARLIDVMMHDGLKERTDNKSVYRRKIR